MADSCVVLLGGRGKSTRFVYHALRAQLPSDVRLEVIVEDPLPRSVLLRRRLARLGLSAVLGQLLFVALVVPVLRLRGRRRVRELVKAYGLCDAPLPASVRSIRSVNSDDAIDLLRRLQPAVVVVNGTRILSTTTLRSVAAPFLNMHAGITPAFRGVHGGYWALAEGRPDLVGTTVHRVDEGIDTGCIVEQVHFGVTPADSFATYPYLHTGSGIPLLVRSVTAALDGGLPTSRGVSRLPSTLRHHPTLWGYFTNRLRGRAQ